METIFRQGMIVYDQVNYPNKKGVVVDIEPACDEDDYPIEVKFEDDYSSIAYTLDGRLELEQIPTLSTKPYEIILKGFEQKSIIPTFKELYEKSFQDDKCYWLNNKPVAPNTELGEAVEAMLKLLFYREYYNEGWVVDWNKNNTEKKYCIEVCDNNFIKSEHVFNQYVMSFKSEEIRNKFLEEQIDLLRIAKPLL